MAGWIDLAQAAKTNGTRAGVPALVSESAVMEAHGLALANDERGCLVALRESEQAFAAAEDRNDRGRLFNVVLLASVLVDQRQVEEACDTGLAALGLASDVRSARTDADLADLSQRLTPFQAEPAVQSLNEQIRALLQRAGGA